MLAFGIMGISVLGIQFTKKIMRYRGPEFVAGKNRIIAEFSFSKTDSSIILPVKLNGQNYQFVLDTGAGVTIFSKRTRSALGEPVGTQKLQKITGFFFIADIYEPPKDFRIGSLPIHVNTVLYIDDFKKYEMGENIDGIVGMDILQNYTIKLDFIKGKVQFFSRNCEYKKDAHQNDFLSTSPTSNLQCMSPHLSAKVDGHKVDFLIDTGLPHPHIAYLENKIFDELFRQNASKLKKVCMGEEVEQGVPANISFDKYCIGPLVFVKRHMSVIGLEFLRLFDSIIFDFPDKSISFYSKSFASITLEDIKITLAVNDENQLVIVFVDEESDAYKAGIRENDYVVEINGVTVGKKDIKEIERIIQTNKTKRFDITTRDKTGNYYKFNLRGK